jgi:hypothetical protein
MSDTEGLKNVDDIEIPLTILIMQYFWACPWPDQVLDLHWHIYGVVFNFWVEYF